MQEQLRSARRASWANTGVARVGKHTAELGSINERRIFQAIRLTGEVAEIRPKPPAVVWYDSAGQEHRYSPDARAKTVAGDSIYLEFKPRGLPKPGSARMAIYEDIGRFLREDCKHRFGLVQWDWSSAFSRNMALLTRYTDDEPSDVAMNAFEEIGHVTVAIGELIDNVDRSQRRAIWASIAHQDLCADLHGTRLSRHTLVSRPREVFNPFVLDDFVSTWWA